MADPADRDDELARRVEAALFQDLAARPVNLPELAGRVERGIRRARRRRVTTVAAAAAAVLTVPLRARLVPLPGTARTLAGPLIRSDAGSAPTSWSVPPPSRGAAGTAVSGSPGGPGASHGPGSGRDPEPTLPTGSAAGAAIPDLAAPPLPSAPIFSSLDLVPVGGRGSGFDLSMPRCALDPTPRADKPVTSRSWHWGVRSGAMRGSSVDLDVTQWPGGSGHQRMQDVLRSTVKCPTGLPFTVVSVGSRLGDEDWTFLADPAGASHYAREVIRLGDVILTVQVISPTDPKTPVLTAQDLGMFFAKRLLATGLAATRGG